MDAIAAQNRMETTAERRRNSCLLERHGFAIQRLFHSIAFFIVVIDAAVLVFETIQRNFVFAQLQSGIQNIAGFYGFAVRGNFVFINDFKLVAFAQIAAKVDAVGKNIDKVGNDTTRNPLFLHGSGQSAADVTGSRIDFLNQFVLFDTRHIFLCLVFLNNITFAEARRNGNIVKGEKRILPAVDRRCNADFLPHAQTTGIIKFFELKIDVMRFVIFQTKVRQNADKRIPFGYFDFAFDSLLPIAVINHFIKGFDIFDRAFGINGFSSGNTVLNGIFHHNVVEFVSAGNRRINAVVIGQRQNKSKSYCRRIAQSQQTVLVARIEINLHKLL